MIRRPRPNEIKLLPQIENEADRRYLRVGLGRIVDMPSASIAALECGLRTTGSGSQPRRSAAL